MLRHDGTVDVDALLTRLAKDCEVARDVMHAFPVDEGKVVITERVTVIEMEALIAKYRDLELCLDAHEDASTPAFDEIAALCGCPEWEYPGQVIRDVKAVVEQRDKLERDNTEARTDILKLLGVAGVTLPFNSLEEIDAAERQVIERFGKDAQMAEGIRQGVSVARIILALKEKYGGN